MRQKLGICCALIHDPDFLILDEPTTGVDPLSRRQFWDLVDRMRARRPGMSVLVATAYMEEADSFDWLIAMDAGRVLAAGSPQGSRRRARSNNRGGFHRVLAGGAPQRAPRPQIPPRPEHDHQPVIAARDLTRRFGDFTAVDHVNFTIERGEIFGFVGPNGCGKTTTMKMLTGLLPASNGDAFLFGRPLDARDIRSRYRVGYMSQSFSLYGELTVRQNLDLHARLFHLPAAEDDPHALPSSSSQFGLGPYLDQGACASARHSPKAFACRRHRARARAADLDEPTSGVDPLARDQFWELLIDLSRNQGVTIFVSTHFMNEAARCDRISLMDQGRVLATDSPGNLIEARGRRDAGGRFYQLPRRGTGPRVFRGKKHRI